MTGISRSSSLSGLPRGACAVCGMLLLLMVAAVAQSPQPAPPPSTAPAYQPGMLDGITRWFKESFNFFGRNVEDARRSVAGIGERAGGAAKDAANAATNAATAAKDAAVGAVGTRVVSGKERCDNAPNGAPDCRHAAEAVCRAKGFTTGSSLDIQTAKNCPTEAYIRRESRDCKVASFVTRAVCQ